MNRDRLIQDIVEMAERLCDAHRHSEPVYERDQHRNKKLTSLYTTTQQGLLAQLRDVMAEGLKVGESVRSGGKPKSKPPGVFEAMNRHVYIAVEAQRWCHVVGLQLRRTPEENVRGLVGKAASLDDHQLAQLHREIRSWHAQAAVSTGWDSPPYSPPVPCPICARHGSLRVNIDQRSAYCTNPNRNDIGDLVCGAFWPPNGIDPLAAYVRQMTEGVLAQTA